MADLADRNNDQIETGLMRVRVGNPDVLIAGFQRVLGDGLAAAGIGEAKDMRIGRAVDALKQVRDFPNHQRRIADAIAVADMDLDWFSASEETQGLLRYLGCFTPFCLDFSDFRALIYLETNTRIGAATRWP
jgi:hypothetical protein